MGHTLSPVVPALVQLKVRKHPFAKAAGVRTDAKVTAIQGRHVLAEDTGEMQITAYGISGIPVFQISRHIAKGLYEGLSLIHILPAIYGYIFRPVRSWDPVKRLSYALALWG